MPSLLGSRANQLKISCLNRRGMNCTDLKRKLFKTSASMGCKEMARQAFSTSAFSQSCPPIHFQTNQASSLDLIHSTPKQHSLLWHGIKILNPPGCYEVSEWKQRRVEEEWVAAILTHWRCCCGCAPHQIPPLPPPPSTTHCVEPGRDALSRIPIDPPPLLISPPTAVNVVADLQI